MKKIILLVAFIVSNHLYSQSITVEAHKKNVDPGCCTTILGDIGTEITVRNTSTSSINIVVSRQTLNQTLGTENYFCWTSCYGSQTSVSPDSKPFSPLMIDNNSFQVHYENNNTNPASAVVKYCAYDEANPSDSACTIVYYNVKPTSVLDDLTTTYFSDFHPNPTSSSTNLDYKLKPSDLAQVVVTDMLGTVVKKEEINNLNGTLKFNVSNTPTGIYFANIIVNGELQSVKRLVVSR
jgi:hypothetical protein